MIQLLYLINFIMDHFLVYAIIGVVLFLFRKRLLYRYKDLFFLDLRTNKVKKNYTLLYNRKRGYIASVLLVSFFLQKFV